MMLKKKILLIVLVFPLCLGVSSCGTVREAERVSRTETVHDTVLVERWRVSATKDSVHVSDSMAVEYKAGLTDSVGSVRVDTVIERHWRRVVSVRQETGAEKEAVSKTLWRTVEKSTARTVYKERELTAWQRFRMRMGTVFCVTILVFLVWFIYRKKD